DLCGKPNTKKINRESINIFFVLLIFFFLLDPVPSIANPILLQNKVFREDLNRLSEKSRFHDIHSFRDLSDHQFSDIKNELDQQKEGLEKERIERVLQRLSLLHKSYSILADYTLLFTSSDASKTIQSDSRPNLLLADSMGARFRNGDALSSIEMGLWLNPSEYFQAYIEPIVAYQVKSYEQHTSTWLRQVYLKVNFRNLSLSIGRRIFSLGQSEYSSLVYTGRNKPLDSIILYSNKPIDFPEKISFLGKGQFALFAFAMDEDQTVPGSIVIGEKISISPSRNFEIGFSQSFQFGGEGAPNLPFTDFALELIGLRRDEDASNLTNRNFNGDFRIRIPKFHDLNIFGEVYMEDCCTLDPRKDISSSTGVSIPDLKDRFSTKVALEFVRTTRVYTRHSIYRSGFTHRGHSLGHNIGPDSIGTYLTFDQNLGLHHGQKLHFAFEVRQIFEKAASGDDIRTSDSSFESPEKYLRAIYEHTWNPRPSFYVRGEFGLQKLWNFQFFDHKDRLDVLTGLHFSWRI
ncbi:MAG: hypothetical protein KDD52_04355, partial [Bdellovibrionales bacterium]|nr:hypothetical protein [Bdellovibrionales bacterium]